ncbi:hypothetical protein FYJ61_07665 [Lactobacillus equicursoris]|uniref:Uncharacterized protein n=1 Tax=Lactobacillus equicursoris TaxID=420645 RepID=A0A844FNW8_9LACO|nr:hypothetical protein [Lactobacillus equicursoris]MST80324.1 hypothetical protein [Lactobacillus equicursoris]
MNSIKKLVSWLGGLVLIILFGLVLITLYNAYYCFGPMIFGEHLASASSQFWFAELLLGGGYTVVVLLIAIGTKLTRKHKNN